MSGREEPSASEAPQPARGTGRTSGREEPSASEAPQPARGPGRNNGLAPEENVLGALALFVTDATSQALAGAGHADSAAAALSALDQFLDRPTLDMLRRVLGLTPSGAVRLVDRLAADGLVTRAPGADGRSRAVSLTAKGRRAAQRIRAARAEVLRAALAELSPAERRSLHALTGQVLASLVRAKLHSGRTSGWTCRLCDLTACGRPEGRCPAATAAASVVANQP